MVRNQITSSKFSFKSGLKVMVEIKESQLLRIYIFRIRFHCQREGERIRHAYGFYLDYRRCYCHRELWIRKYSNSLTYLLLMGQNTRWNCYKVRVTTRESISEADGSVDWNTEEWIMKSLPTRTKNGQVMEILAQFIVLASFDIRWIANERRNPAKT